MLVGVKHDSNGLAESSGWEVLDELGAHETTLSVGGDDLAPDRLVVDASLRVASSVDVGDALAVVEGAGLTVSAVLDVDEGVVLFLRPLASLESSENSLGVESTRQRMVSTVAMGLT